MLMVSGVMVLFAGAMALNKGDSLGIGTLAAGLALLLLAGPLSRIRSRQAARRLTHLTGPCRAWAVPGVGLSVTSGRSTGRVPWARFIRVRETRRAFLLFTAGRAVLPTVLAKRGLTEPAQVDALRDLLHQETSIAR